MEPWAGAGTGIKGYIEFEGLITCCFFNISSPTVGDICQVLSNSNHILLLGIRAPVVNAPVVSTPVVSTLGQLATSGFWKPQDRL